MKSSQILIEAANLIAGSDIESLVSRNIFGCYAIQDVLGINTYEHSAYFKHEAIEYYKNFGNIERLTHPYATTWFNSTIFYDFNLFGNYEKLNEIRILALCFASYIAYLEGN